jgi:hypothetical protein
MDPETVLNMAQAHGGSGNAVALLVLTAVAAAVGALVGEYLRARGKTLATQHDFQQLLAQQTKTTQAIQDVLRRSSFRDKILLERYNLIRDTSDRLDNVRINYCRMKEGKPCTIEIVSGETRLLTEVDSILRLNRAVLTRRFHDLLRQRYELVRLLWEHMDDEASWSEQLGRDDGLVDALQSEMDSVFGFREATV